MSTAVAKVEATRSPAPTNVTSLGRRGGAAAALVAYTCLAVAMFSSSWVNPTTLSIGLTGDPQEIMWFLGWPPFAITHGLNPLFTNYIDYPGGVNLMWNTSELLPGLVLGPLTSLGGFVLAWNVLMTAAVALSAWTAFLLIRRFVPNQVAAGVGGLLYGFSPYMTAHSLGHPHATLAFMPPILLLLLDEIVRVQRRRPLVSGLLLGVAAAAQLLIGEEMLATAALAAFLLLCLAVGLFPDQFRSRINHAARALVAAGVVFAVLVAVPVGFQFFGPQHLRGVVHTPNAYVSDALSFLVPTDLFLVAPAPAIRISRHFIGGNAVETNSYIGVLLFLLLAFIVVRYWRRPEVRLAALGSALIAILSMGVTIHLASRASSIPVFAFGLVFPLLQRYLPGRLMLYLTVFGWLALSRFPVLDNVLPSRLMVYFYLLAGLLLAVWLDDLRTWQPTARRLGWLAMAAALVLLVPALPFPSTTNTMPAFFAGAGATQIPPDSVALVIPYSTSGDARAMVWQEKAGMRFRMPEGYAFIPDALPAGSRLSPPPSATQTQTIAVANGHADPMTDETRQQILSELTSWHVQTVMVGPMINQQQEVDLFTSVLARPPQLVDDVYVWWGVGASRPS
jgi:hypothetical protein